MRMFLEGFCMSQESKKQLCKIVIKTMDAKECAAFLNKNRKKIAEAIKTRWNELK